MAAGAVLLVVLTALALVLRESFGERVNPAGYRAGQQIDVPGHMFSEAALTGLLFVRSSCGVCQETKALYAEVLRSLRSAPGFQIRLVASERDAAADLAYARELGLSEREFGTIDMSRLRLRRVPTLVIVDKQGTIVASWEGAPMSEERATFVETVKSAIRR